MGARAARRGLRRARQAPRRLRAHEPSRRARPPRSLLPRRARRRALLAVVPLQVGRRAPSRARARRRPHPPLRQSSEQPHRLAGRRRRAAAQGALPDHRRALPPSAPGALPAGLRRHPGLPPPGRPRPRRAQRRRVRRLPGGVRAGPAGGDLSGGHDARRGARAAHQDGRRSPRARLRVRASGRAGDDPGRALVRGAQVVPQPGAGGLRRAHPARRLPRGVARGSREGGGRADPRSAVGDGGAGRQRRAARRPAPPAGDRGAVPRRAGRAGDGIARPRPSRRRPRAPVALDRRRRAPLQGRRPRAGGAALAAHRGLSLAAGPAPPARRGRARAAPEAAGAHAPGLLVGRDRGLPVLRVRRPRQRAAVLPAPLAGAPDGAQGDRLCHDPLPRRDHCVSAFLWLANRSVGLFCRLALGARLFVQSAVLGRVCGQIFEWDRIFPQ